MVNFFSQKFKDAIGVVVSLFGRLNSHLAFPAWGQSALYRGIPNQFGKSRFTGIAKSRRLARKRRNFLRSRG